MPIGLLVLLSLAALIFFGFAQRVLDRMRLTDMQALLVIGLMIVGSYVSIPLFGGSRINVGGAVIPFLLVIYLLVQAGTAQERWRSILAAIVTAVAVALVGVVTGGAPHAAEGRRMVLDPLWLSGLVAGLVGYLAGRSRRGAFVAGVGGLLLADLYNLFTGPSPTLVGGAGIYDQVVIAGVLAVGLAELVGESRERLQGGPDLDESRPVALHQDEGGSEADHDKGDE